MLLDRGLAADSCCAARAIGYRQALQFLQRCHVDIGAATGANLVRVCLASGPVLTCNQGAWLLQSALPKSPSRHVRRPADLFLWLLFNR